MSDEVADTYTTVLAGRPIVFRRATLGQVMVLQRMALRMIKQAEGDSEDEGKALTSAVMRTLDFVESLVISEQDRQFIEDQMLAGNIDYQEIMAVLGAKGEQAPDDEAPQPIKRAPKKSSKAAAARTPVARGRAKR